MHNKDGDGYAEYKEDDEKKKMMIIFLLMMKDLNLLMKNKMNRLITYKLMYVLVKFCMILIVNVVQN